MIPIRILIAALVLLSASAANAQSDGSLTPLSRPGRSVDIRQFSHRRSVRLYPSAQGVSRYAFAPADLAVARPDLGDVRIVDVDGRQVPFVIESGRRERMSVPVSFKARRGSVSAYEIELSAAPVTITALELEVSAPFVDRSYRVVDGDNTIAAGNLQRRAGHGARVELPLTRETRVESLTLHVNDGDDAPLLLEDARVTIATADLFVVAEGGAYRLVMGQADLSPPRYELRGARQQVLNAAAGEVHAGPLESNPMHAPTFAAAPAAPRDQSLILWVAIAASVLILGALTLRVAVASDSAP